jgi:ABC-type oligopeptide transport system ATPase subunit
MTDAPILNVTDLSVHFPIRGPFGRSLGQIKALDGVSFTLANGEILGLVGESGCGKSTLGKTLMGIQAPSHGSILFDGTEIAGRTPRGPEPCAAACNMPIKTPAPRLTRAGRLAGRWKNR